MARAENTPFNVRSRFARQRAEDLALQTGLSVTQVVEGALRAYAPPVEPGRRVRHRLILVMPALEKSITWAEAEAALAACARMAPTIEALLDSHVVVAVVAAAHEHHAASSSFWPMGGSTGLRSPRIATPKPIAP